MASTVTLKPAKGTVMSSIQKLNLVSVGLSGIGCSKARNEHVSISGYMPDAFIGSGMIQYLG